MKDIKEMPIKQVRYLLEQAYAPKGKGGKLSGKGAELAIAIRGGGN